MFCCLPYPLFLSLRLYALFRSGLLVSPPFFTLLVPSFPSTSLRLFSYPAGFPPLLLPSLPAVSTRSSLLPSVSFSVSYVAAFFFTFWTLSRPFLRPCHSSYYSPPYPAFPPLLLFTFFTTCSLRAYLLNTLVFPGLYGPTSLSTQFLRVLTPKYFLVLGPNTTNPALTSTHLYITKNAIRPLVLGPNTTV